MKKYIYKELYELESKHWWFVGKKHVVFSLLNKFLPDKKNNNILDVGCGCGITLNDLEEFGKVYGMDSSSEALKYSKKIFKGEVKQGTLPDNIPYSKNYFDLIVALDVLEHVDDDINSFKNIQTFLNDNGIFIVTVPAFKFLWSDHDEVHYHKRRYTKAELEEKLTNAGFDILKLSYYNTFLFTPIVLMRLSNKLFRFKTNTHIKVPNIILNYLFEKIFSFEGLLLRSMNFPFGVSLIAIAKKK